MSDFHKKMIGLCRFVYAHNQKIFGNVIRKEDEKFLQAWRYSPIIVEWMLDLRDSFDGLEDDKEDYDRFCKFIENEMRGLESLDKMAARRLVK
jgi:hypothetical protein